MLVPHFNRIPQTMIYNTYKVHNLWPDLVAPPSGPGPNTAGLSPAVTGSWKGGATGGLSPSRNDGLKHQK